MIKHTLFYILLPISIGYSQNSLDILPKYVDRVENPLFSNLDMLYNVQKVWNNVYFREKREYKFYQHKRCDSCFNYYVYGYVVDSNLDIGIYLYAQTGLFEIDEPTNFISVLVFPNKIVASTNWIKRKFWCKRFIKEYGYLFSKEDIKKLESSYMTKRRHFFAEFDALHDEDK